MSNLKKSGKPLLNKSEQYTLTKADLIEKIYEKITHSKQEAQYLMALVFKKIQIGLVKDEKVKISGFGIFIVQHKKQRNGRNPKTGEPMLIPSRKTLTFHTSQILKDHLNKE